MERKFPVAGQFLAFLQLMAVSTMGRSGGNSQKVRLGLRMWLNAREVGAKPIPMETSHISV